MGWDSDDCRAGLAWRGDGPLSSCGRDRLRVLQGYFMCRAGRARGATVRFPASGRDRLMVTSCAAQVRPGMATARFPVRGRGRLRVLQRYFMVPCRSSTQGDGPLSHSWTGPAKSTAGVFYFPTPLARPYRPVRIRREASGPFAYSGKWSIAPATESAHSRDR